jgi:hypothetical protein
MTAISFDVSPLTVFLWGHNEAFVLVVWNVRWGDPDGEDNIKMDVQEVGGGRGDWRELAQDRDGWRALVSTAKNLRVP